MSLLPDGIICTPEEYQRSLTDRTITCLTRGDIVGLTIIVEAGLLSLVAILYLFTLILRRVIWRLRHVSRARLRLFHHPMDILIFSLICADIVQAIGMVLNLKWIIIGKSEVGSFCTLQGVVKVIGATGVALSTLAIAIYTFLGVWMMQSISSMGITIGVVLAIWIFEAILVIAGFARHPGKGKQSYMTPSPYWCWVSVWEWKILTEYLWLWTALILSILIYVPLYLWMRGNLVFDEVAWWKCYFKRATNDDPSSRFARRQSLVMLAYPLVYCFCVLMLSVVRWIQFGQQRKYGTDDMPSAATFVGNAIFGLSGFFNVILLITTRPESGLFGQLMFRYPTAPPSIVEPDQGIDAEGEEGYEIERLPSR